MNTFWENQNELAFDHLGNNPCPTRLIVNILLLSINAMYILNKMLSKYNLNS